MNRIEEAIKFLGLGMTGIKKDAGHYFITEKYKEVFAEKFRELFPQPIIEKALREKARLTDEEIDGLLPTDKEVDDYLATPDDEVAANLRKNLDAESFRSLGKQILFHRKIADTATDKALTLLQQRVGEAMRQRQGWLANVCGWRNPEQIAEKVEESKKQGIKEVVDWVKDNRTTPLGKDAYGYYIWEATLQAKLKEWGIALSNKKEGE